MKVRSAFRECQLTSAGLDAAWLILSTLAWCAHRGTWQAAASNTLRLPRSCHSATQPCYLSPIVTKAIGFRIHFLVTGCCLARCASHGSKGEVVDWSAVDYTTRGTSSVDRTGIVRKRRRWKTRQAYRRRTASLQKAGQPGTRQPGPSEALRHMARHRHGLWLPPAASCKSWSFRQPPAPPRVLDPWRFPTQQLEGFVSQ
ncbi:hypothetical protein L209DRAFT_516247 [Thermothelomyces heterothallicus CBS 203.75]